MNQREVHVEVTVAVEAAVAAGGSKANAPYILKRVVVDKGVVM